MSASPQRRGRVVAIVLIVIALVAAPTTAAAYWVATATTIATGRSATFAVSALAPAPVAMGGSSNDLQGFSGSAQTSTIVKNTGEVAWGNVDVAVATPTPSEIGFAQLEVSLALVGATGTCPSDFSAYTRASSAGAVNFSSQSARVQPGDSAIVCALITYSRLSMLERAAGIRLSLTVSPRLQRWTAPSTPMDIAVDTARAGVAQCRSGSTWSWAATLTFEAPASGTYAVRVGGSSTALGAIDAGGQLSFAVGARFLDWGRREVIVERVDASGKRTPIADARLAGGGLAGPVTCVR